MPADYTGRKFVRRDEALIAFRLSRARIDDDVVAEADATLAALEQEASPPKTIALGSNPSSASSSLASAKTEKEELVSELLRMRLARERGELISRGAQLAAFEAAGSAVARSWQALPTWAEELFSVAQQGGVSALTALLRAKAVEQCAHIADLMAAAAADESESSDDEWTCETAKGAN
ncbi:hypothetical protein EHO51_04130 [Methylocystis rosea]|uniref:Uncharacterized protein n=1 Tax=Methylocystis rosea TaxID=173366 RepID=A0A3G8M2T8_9HYPH|nr:hypothetical protein EHO51_04130 [Methylocystis rosea]